MTRLEELKAKKSNQLNRISTNTPTRLEQLKESKGITSIPIVNPVVSTLKNASVIQTANDVKQPTLTYKQAEQIAKENNIKIPNKLTLPNFKTSTRTPIVTSEDLQRAREVEVKQEQSNKGIFKTPDIMQDNLRRFEDGYQFGDVTKSIAENAIEGAATVGGTIADVGLNIGKGILSVPENMAKAGSSLIAGGADLIGQDEFANALRKQIATKNIYTDPTQKLINKVDKASIAGNFTDDVAGGIGQVGAYVATSKALGGAGNIVLGKLSVPTTAILSGAGASASEAYKKTDESVGLDNMTWKEKAQNATKIVGGGLIEGLSEGLFGLFGVGGMEVTDMLAKSLVKKANTTLGKVATKMAVSGLGESAEELISYAGNWALDNGLINNMGEVDYSQKWDGKQVVREMLTAFLTSAITQGGTSSVQLSNAVKTELANKEQELGRALTNKERTQEIRKIADSILADSETIETTSETNLKTTPQNNTNLEETSPNTVQLEQNNVQNAQDLQKTVQSEPQIQEETVETNIGNIPIAEYRDIMAQQTGFNDYADMRRQGYKLGNKYDVEVQEVQEAQVDKSPTLDLRKIAQNYIEEGNISEQDKQILRETIDSATDAEIDGDLLHGLRNIIKEQERFQSTAQNNNVETALTRAISNKDSKGKIILGKINDFAKNKIQQLLGKDVSNRQHVLNDNDIRHMLKEHGNPEVESRKGQIAVTEEDIKKIPDILENPTDIVIGTKNKDGDAIRYVKKYEDNNTFVVEVVPDKGNNLIIKTMWKKPIALADNLIPASTSETQGNLGNSTSNINNIIPTFQNYVNKNIPTQAEQQQAQQELRNKLPTEEQQNQEQEEKIAEILDDTSAQETNYKELAKDAVTTFRRLFVDSGADIAEIGKIANDETLYHMYNSAKQAGQSANHMISEAQTNWQGEKVGKSLVDIFEPIRQKGQDYYKEFEYYMYHLHNIDRMNLKGKALDELRLFEMEHPEFTTLSQEELEKIAKQEIKEKSEIQVANEYLRLINKYEKATDKPVFGESITSEKSQNIVKQFESKYPEFKEYANDIRTWNANLQQYRIDTGLISQEQADLMNEMYPNYVPTYRDVNGISGATKNGNTVRIVNTIKKATGSNKDILPLHEQMARQVMQTVQAGRRNLLGMQLYNDVIKNSDKLGKYVQEIKTTKEDIDTDAEFEFEKSDLEGKFVIFDDGEKIEMQVSNGVLDGLKALASAKWENNVWSKGARKVNSIFKKLVTEWNPFFIFKNASRDIQDAGFYSEKAKEFYKNYPQAWKEITSDGEIWKKYLAMGGSDASLFDFEQGYVIPKDGIPANAMQKIKEANFLVEQAPRFAEFLRIYNESDKSYESLIKAMYGAADITVNFGRSGTWGKFINNNLVPFFNPAVQGTSKTLRTITGDGKVKGAKNYAKHMANIVGKGVLLGVTPTMINHILLSVFGGDDYDDLNERDKDMYYLIPIGDGKYFKVAKGRVLSVIGGFARRGFEYAMGDKDVFEGFGKFALEQTAPSNPFENNLYSPIQAVKNNTTWYGTPIENESLQNLRPSQRYDEGTTEFAKGLGKTFNVSPKKIDYVLDAYGGVAADVLMPLNTKKAETSGFGKSFILDSTYSNKLSTDFYDTIEELTFDKNDDDPVAKMQLKYMNDVKEKAQDINKQIKDLQASDVENKEKLKQVRDLREEVNTLQRDALSTYEKYGETANKYLNDKSITEIALRGTKEDSTEETKQQNIEKTVKLYTDKELFGAEYALKEYDKRLVEKKKKSKLDADTFFKIYFAQKGITGDKNKITGKTQEGSEKKKKIEAMHKAVPKLTPWELNKLYELLN